MKPTEHPRYLEAPIGDRAEAFDAYELDVVAEYADPSGGTFCEAHADESDEEAVGFMFTLYGHFPSGGVHAIADARFGGEGWSRAEALTYIRQLAGSVADGKPIYDYIPEEER